MSRFTSLFEDSESNASQPGSNSEGGLVGEKFKEIREDSNKRKLGWFTEEARVNKYAALKKKNPHSPDNVLKSEVLFLTEEEQAAVQKRVEDDLRRLEFAMKDANAFKKYFFDDLVPIIQENTWALIQQQVFDPAERERRHQKTRDTWRSTHELTFKLLLSSLADASSTGTLKDWFVRKVKNLKTQFGLNHTALQFGPYLMDWADCELVMPRSFKATNAVLLIPINQNFVLPKTDDVLIKISQFVVDWNLNWKYGKESKPSQRQGNCQYFVERMCQYLGVTTSWMKNGPIEKNIEKLKNNTANPDSLKIWDQSGEHEFSNHKALGDYYESVVRTNRNDRTREESELVLKSIERCMMFRYWATKNDQFKVERPIFNPKFKIANPTAKPSSPSNVLFSSQNQDDEGPEYEDDFSDFPPAQVTGMLAIPSN